DEKMPAVDKNNGVTSPHARTTYTWGDLESIKSKAACAIDRCEFLNSSRNKFTEFRAAEAGKIGFAIRSRSQPHLLMSKTLSTGLEDASSLLDAQQKRVSEAKTGLKRLDAVNKYVIDKEKHTGGEEGQKAAENSAKSTQLFKRPYPLYAELYNLRTHELGKPREQPLGPCTLLQAYQPNPAALRHGMQGTHLSSMNSMAKSTKSVKSPKAAEE
ncbi:unnamed protein product, partial [Polarella glacialis]